MKTVDIHIFTPGTQTSAQGVTREFTKDDLQQVVDSYQPSVHEAPIRVGHTDNDKVPSWGWVKGVKMKGEDLYAEVEFSPLMEDYVKNGLYKKVSASFYAPESKINPEPGQWSLRHVAMLGAQPPAVKGLKGFAYSEESEGEGILDFAVATKLSPEQVFDEELGPTLKDESSPLEYLQKEIEEARTEMAAEAKEKAEAQAQTEEMMANIEDGASEEETEFAEGDKKKKAPAGKQGAEDAEEEIEGDGEDTVDNASGCGSRKKKGSSYTEDEAEHGELPPALKKNAEKKKAEAKGDDEDEDSVDNKEKMDPVGKEDGDVDNDGDKDSSDEYLKKRRAAIKKAMKEDSSDNSEIAIPEGVDAAQFEAGFKDALDKFYAATEAGADEVVHEEAEDQTADYLAGIEAGFEFGQARLNRIGSDNVGSASHNDKCCDTDEESEGEGPVATKVKKNAKHGANETDVEAGNNFEEGLNKINSDKKRGKEGVASTKVVDGEEDEVANAENDFGRDKTGKTKASDASDRKKKGVAGKGSMGRDSDYQDKGSDGGAQEADRKKKGSHGVPKQDGGKSKDVQDAGHVEMKHLGDGSGTGKAIKSPAVRVLKFSEAQFSELSERLEQLEALNAKLVQEKVDAERKAHRLQLEDFAESLYATGRLTEAVMEQEALVDYMEGLENGTLEFAEGESAATPLMSLLAALPQQVCYTEVAAHNPEEVREEDLNPHERALRLSKEEGMDYTEALKQTLFSAE
jgi:hypothetical protein